MYDVIIIGAGPAGLTAAVYTARKKLSTLVLSENIGGQAALSSDIENYLGFQLVTGAELVRKFEDHIKEFDLDLELGSNVKSIIEVAGGFEVETKDDRFNGRVIIIASGKIPKRLNISGEKEFLGKGVTYCATCDAPLFSRKDVAVIGGGNSALDATLQSTKIANKIYLININPKLGGDEVVKEKIEAAENVTILNSTETLKVKGDVFVQQLKIKDIISGSENNLDVQGVFIEIGSIPSVNFVPSSIKHNEIGEIIVDARNRTNIPGIFACGDVTEVLEKQIIIAAGEGSKAALGAYEYLARTKIPPWS